jgi:pimeloyl-ACP methyl ester carboxylesterase
MATAIGAMAFSAAAEPARLLPGDAALRARYELPASKFMLIDGEPIHYVDEGRGEPIVLIHGSFASLRQWDGWARILSKHYRIIRFDKSPEGLSGPNPQGDYSVPRRIEVIDRLTRKLGIKRFFLVATSSGGDEAAGFAAQHPDRVKGLVLNNIAADDVVFEMSNFSPDLKAALADDAHRNGHHIPEYWRQILLHVFYDGEKVTPAMAQEWTDLNSRALLMPPAPTPAGAPKVHSPMPGDLPRITSPTLVLWTANDPETTLAKDGRKTLDGLASNDKTLVVVPNCGHEMPMECSDEGVALALPFFARIDATDP